MSIQLICVNHGNALDAEKVMRHCMKHMPFEVKTLFHERPGYCGDIETVTAWGTPNEVWVHEVPKYIVCDHAMAVHWDGYIINPLAWTSDFLNYDWIGAPWPGDVPNPDWRVGNGGFCIFSKRMAQAWAKLADTKRNHDWQICAEDRAKYEALGMKFAPIELAAKFSKECECPDYPVKEWETFGFHDFTKNPERVHYRRMVYGS
jgi:hypothetical protein